MALNKYFRFPFARSGDKTAVPDAVVPGGNVSYDQGYGPDYQLVKTNPQSKDIERDKMNQVFSDITTAIQEYQQNGTPDWISNAQNGGVAFPYPADARVRYTDGFIYRSLQAANITVPGAGAWARETPTQGLYRVIGLYGGNNGVAPSTQMDFACTGLVLVRPSDRATFSVGPIGAKTCNTAIAGPAANGRDQAGAFAASNWIHFYYIFNPTTGTVDTICSLVAPTAGVGPTLPAGYVAWAYIGPVYFNASSQLFTGNFRGSWFHYDSIRFAINGGTSTGLVAVPVPTLVPPNAPEFELFFQNLAITASGTGNYILNAQIVTQANQIVNVGLQGAGVASVITGVAGLAKRIANLGQSFAYQLTVSAGVGPTVSIAISSYGIPNGS